ncbi:TetR family transcriptional regulator [Actinotalea sp. M2MS4P-6]|uniref:TetR family transcriptional regulator n=1 Tax=Actinotalea sp. M2MS4P-6 TaxID=2983762 RepID=UPI0021E3E2F7|nr:TetR family transcriptional regulator [Actinotalea sp. M2MS4P-6]MCV2396256.1 TetR family transcriptional regulator [Actinotalea sp. M2MS4P-6]
MPDRREPGAQPSLRERKRARARADLQRVAIDLVEERGYAAVSVEDICAAAEVSRSTFFRYYGTKAAVFEADLPAEQFWPLVEHQPAYSLAALRSLIAESYRAMDDADFDQERRRIHLLQTVPELRPGFAQEALRPMGLTLAYCARILRSDQDDPRVRLLGGAVFGVLATMQLPDADGTIELPATKDAAAARVEAAIDGLIAMLDPSATTPGP